MSDLEQWLRGAVVDGSGRVAWDLCRKAADILTAVREIVEPCQEHPELELGLARKILHILDRNDTG